MNAETLFAKALAGEDEAYLRAEAGLRESADAEVLESNLSADDPIARLMAHVMLDWADADPGFEGADRYLDVVEHWFADTIVRTPPVDGVVENLTAKFGGRLGEFLALRLVKVPTTPAWRAQVALSYLERHPTPAATDALIRYASLTSVPALQGAVARVVTKFRDPALARKVSAERDRLAREGRGLPSALTSLIA
ncbi:hypothetical protein [Actinoplanes aureus]|uniref:Uncharacterized protein n=1 Tax=Actinoplanes aureus TaxID=2792083 RepID=A0A931CER8_9ACTN|nr:hypothetical protein [Actinoplanes aureus]MBG0564858.1 hypothetical protein [Actinoplanes aureus]